MEPYRRCFHGVRGYGGERVMASFPAYGTGPGVGYNARDAARQSQLRNKGTTIKGSQTLRVDMSQWVEKFNPQRVRVAMNKYADELGRRMVQYAQANRPWNDRTGNARQMLHANIKHVSVNRTNVQLSHGVFYGKYLEFGTIRMPMYPIIKPTKEHFAPIIEREIARLAAEQFK